MGPLRRSSHLSIALMLLVTPLLLQSTSAQSTCGSQAGGALCPNNLCCSQFGFCGSTPDYCGSTCQTQCLTTPTPSGGGSGVSGIVTSDLFSQIFPNRDAFYTYDGFISATNAFPAFGTTGDSTAQKREIAAFFGQVSHETSGLVYIREVDQSNSYCDTTNTQYPCVSGQSYFGRGPLQLSWNYNYGAAGQAIGQDLLNSPELVANDPAVSFEAALWFWTTPQAPKPACHDVMVGNWIPSADDIAAGRQPGFGVTIDIINGGLECGAGSANAAQAADRVQLYQSICATLGVDPGSNLDCSNMQPF